MLARFFIILFLICFNAACIQSSLVSGETQAQVIGVKDGDTIELLSDEGPVVVRLADVDTPEKNQPFGKRAKAFTSDFCFGKVVTVQHQNKKDRYGRIIGTVVYNNRILNEELVKAGLAWHYKRYSSESYYSILEKMARAEKVGLWAEPDAVAPWEWRKQKRKKHRSSN